MAPAGAAKSNGQVALALPHVVRQQINQQLSDALQKFLGLRKRTNVLRHLGMASGVRPQSRNEVGIGQKAHVENQVSILRHALLVAKADARDKNIFVVANIMAKAVNRMRAQLMDVEL